MGPCVEHLLAAFGNPSHWQARLYLNWVWLVFVFSSPCNVMKSWELGLTGRWIDDPSAPYSETRVKYYIFHGFLYEGILQHAITLGIRLLIRKRIIRQHCSAPKGIEVLITLPSGVSVYLNPSTIGSSNLFVFMGSLPLSS